MPSEFDIIRDFFTGLGTERPDVVLGVGDDCALLATPPGQSLAVTVDTLVEGVHFPRGVDPEDLGWKALAVNLSDLAAMGARPAWVTLAITLPVPEAIWLAAFRRGFGALARFSGVALVGGDTTQGPLSITVQAMGFVDPQQALRRSGARPGDLLYVTGTIGDGGVGLECVLGRYAPPAEDRSYLEGRLHRPTPRIEAGVAFVGLASAAIDISDGLLADLGHICEGSRVGAIIEAALVPLSGPAARWHHESGDWQRLLAAGDDYELCIAVPPDQAQATEAAAVAIGVRLSPIGHLDTGPGVRCRLPDGTLLAFEHPGYDHFGGEHPA